MTDVDLIITSYGSLLRLPWLANRSWRVAVLDEAQAIKNPAAKQTRAIKKLDAQTRIALTGTPVENRLADLWSIFDFLEPAAARADLLAQWIGAAPADRRGRSVSAGDGFPAL